jgi:hypothetical protein
MLFVKSDPYHSGWYLLCRQKKMDLEDQLIRSRSHKILCAIADGYNDSQRCVLESSGRDKINNSLLNRELMS